ncbi:MAG: HAMP domain-containing protein [Candidatus Aminicenantes bacterium]|nr:HAMP domain-containing protein [Candidatus Aminicenantes bacterium]
MSKKRIGIRFRLIAVMILLTIVPLTVTGYFLAKINEESIKIQAKEYQLALSEQLTEISHNLVDETRAELVEIKMLLNDRKLSTEHTIRLVGYKISTSGRIDFVNIYNTEGAFVDTLLLQGNEQPVFSPETLNSATRQKLKAQYCFTGSVISHNSRLLLPICVPWKSEEQLQGYLWTTVNITPLSLKLNRIIHDRFSSTIHSAYLVDENFDTIVHSGWKEIPEHRNVKESPLFQNIFRNSLLPKKGVGISFDHEDSQGEWLINLNTIPRFNWLVVALQEKSRAYKTLYDMQKKIVLVGSIFILAAILLGSFLGGRMSRPILKVAHGARELAAENFSHRIDVKNADEIGEMARAFNFLGQSLEEYDARIKKEVAIRSDLSRYLTPELVESIMQRRANLNLGGRRQQVTILFADVVSFTPLAESLPSERIVSLLNELFTILTGIIFRNRGMIDKFIGDCVMALFGVPDPHPEAPARAVQTAREMIRWLDVGNKKWQKEYKLSLQLAISIHCGEVIIGNVGSEKRMEFTAIGDVVNTAARLEKIAQANQVLITGSVWNELKNRDNIKPFGRFELRGKNREIDVFEVLT